MMKKFALVFVFSIFYLSVFARSYIVGNVVDENSAPIAFASITYEVGDSVVGGETTNLDGQYRISLAPGVYKITFSSLGYSTKVVDSVVVRKDEITTVDAVLQEEAIHLSEVVVKTKTYNAPLIRESDAQTFVTGQSTRRQRRKMRRSAKHPKQSGIVGSVAGVNMDIQSKISIPTFPDESYAEITENQFHSTKDKPLSTFSIDVDNAAYTNVRRYLNMGIKPPVDAVKIEEMINYFSYDYPEPTGADPFEIYTEMAYAPWNKKHQLLHIGIQGKKIPVDQLPPSNIVFLIDVSGSMQSINKLVLIKSAFRLFVQKLRKKDKVAIVVYAGNAGLVLPSTSGSEKRTLLKAIDNLTAGGSTAGGAGIKLAYKVAKENFISGGNNRIILATDGDFNVGASSDDDMESLIVKERKSGIFLTCLGFGMGNYKDSKLERLADKGNGNYSYIDNMLEAQKTLITEFGGTFFTIAKDVKIQIEFNPAYVQSYRLIGYENRLLADKDFNDDTKDAGELGAGHTVTALYEIIPVGVESEFTSDIDPLKYQKVAKANKIVIDNYSSELATVKFRYKKPAEETSKKIVHVIKTEHNDFVDASERFRFAASVAYFGMYLRASEYVKENSLEDVVAYAENAKGKDAEGYRSEFIRLVRTLK